jgi:TonB family protein
VSLELFVPEQNEESKSRTVQPMPQKEEMKENSSDRRTPMNVVQKRPEPDTHPSLQTAMAEMPEAPMDSNRFENSGGKNPVFTVTGSDGLQAPEGSLDSADETGIFRKGSVPGGRITGANGTNGEGDKLVTNMQFSDFERIFEKEALAARENHAAETLEKRRKKGSFAPNTEKIRAALNDNRSALIGASVIPSGEHRPLMLDYLQVIYRKIGPRFSSFLATLDGPMGRMRRKFQSGFMEHNPFYVEPPPAANRPGTLVGPQTDYSITAVTEFEILKDGNLSAVRLLKTSSHEMFDAAAVDAIMKSDPFAPPPSSLLSDTHRAYIQWTFSRDGKQNTPHSGRVLLVDSKYRKDK